MEFDGIALSGLLAALGGGLLVGIERERRHGESTAELPAGVRTCILVALAGALAAVLGMWALIVAGIGVIAFTLASYLRSQQSDLGLTSEFALLTTFLLGVLAMSHTQLAAALFVLLTIVLASKESLHRFTLRVLSREELGDILLLAASVLIVLPLLPDRAIDPFAVLNPRKLWLFAVLVMAINAAGYVALRAFGSGRGLALAGLFGGFVSSTATIAGMGQRARNSAAMRPYCIAAALLSNVATLVQIAFILTMVAPALMLSFAMPLGAAGIAALVIAGLAMLHARGMQHSVADTAYGRPFALSRALLFAALVALALFGAAVLRTWMGAGGVFAAATATGFADVHAAAVALGQLVAANDVPVEQATQALAFAFTANSAVKCVGAMFGGFAFAWPVIAGIAATNATVVLTLVLAAAG